MEQKTNDFIWLSELLSLNGMPRAKILPFYLQITQGCPVFPGPGAQYLLSLPDGAILFVRVRVSGVNDGGGFDNVPSMLVTPPQTFLQSLSTAACSSFEYSNLNSYTYEPGLDNAFICAEIIQFESGVAPAGQVCNVVWVVEGYQIVPL